jgi:V/A-type H+-transporting ATPase subunit C
MKGRLFRREGYEGLLTAEGIDGVISALSQSPYGDDINAALVVHRGFSCVAEALRRNFAAEVSRMRTFYEDQPRNLLDTVLARWDIFSLKAILRGRAAEVPTEEIMETVVPAGNLQEAELEEIAQQPDLRASVELIATWRLPFASILVEELDGYQRTGDLGLMDLALDRYYFDTALRGLTGNGNVEMVGEVLEAEIDVANIMAVLRLVSSGVAVQELQRRFQASGFLPILIASGETMSYRRLSSLEASAGFEQVLSGLEGTPFGRVLRAEESRELVGMESALERYLIERGTDLLRRDPLSIGVPLGYIWAKRNEMINLRIIAQGKVRGLPVERIREQLFVPLG